MDQNKEAIKHLKNKQQNIKQSIQVDFSKNKQYRKYKQFFEQVQKSYI
ncbi:unnamed protein product [Paramecium sonneborni]|uniref:Uncharacterized protein n=1 Tax=Paramecium sonneborni TaxID=65129 RepID=A0A8S1MU59_9CILI|nr:unnamed protein product [Paramecium sonneborni]